MKTRSAKKPRITVRSAKNKGKLLQNTVRDAILERFEELERDDVKSTTMGEGGCDVQLSPAARKLVPLSVECKSLAKFAFYKHYDQAVANTIDGTEPVLVAKANRRKPVAIVDLDFFLDLMRGK